MREVRSALAAVIALAGFLVGVPIGNLATATQTAALAVGTRAGATP